jgi:hypothetical protein
MFEQFANILVYQIAYQWRGLDASSHTAAAPLFIGFVEAGISHMV